MYFPSVGLFNNFKMIEIVVNYLTSVFFLSSLNFVYERSNVTSRKLHIVAPVPIVILKQRSLNIYINSWICFFNFGCFLVE